MCPISLYIRTTPKMNVFMKIDIEDVGFGVLAAVVRKTYTFCNTMPCSPLKVNRRFGGICHLHFQGRRISQKINQCKASNMQVSSAC
jgi:hypothetical protein